MDTPVIFFSHTSEDARMLGRLKKLFLQKTSESIKVFLSSDGQSIPFGRNWVTEIEAALRGSAIMFVFITPSSLQNPEWVLFESGFAYCKGVRVVPIGMLGVDLISVKHPIGLLQGFNITSEHALANIVAIANTQFGCCHDEHFTPEEYLHVIGKYDADKSRVFGRNASHISSIHYTLHINDKSVWNENLELAREAITKIEQIIKDVARSENVEFCNSSYDLEHTDSFGGRALQIEMFGMSYCTGRRGELTISIDPDVYTSKYEFITKLIESIISIKVSDDSENILFSDDSELLISLSGIRLSHGTGLSITAKLSRTSTKMVNDRSGYYTYDNVQFRLDPFEFIVENHHLPTTQIGQLIDMLVEAGVFQVSG